MSAARRTVLALSVAFTFLVLGVGQASATCRDDYQFAPDKQKHFAGSALISGFVAQTTDSKWAGFFASAAIGAAIEISDSKRDKCGSWQDFAFDLLGNLSGLAGQHLLIGPNRIVFRKEF